MTHLDDQEREAYLTYYHAQGDFIRCWNMLENRMVELFAHMIGSRFLAYAVFKNAKYLRMQIDFIKVLLGLKPWSDHQSLPEIKRVLSTINAEAKFRDRVVHREIGYVAKSRTVFSRDKPSTIPIFRDLMNGGREEPHSAPDIYIHINIILEMIEAIDNIITSED